MSMMRFLMSAYWQYYQATGIDIAIEECVCVLNIT